MYSVCRLTDTRALAYQGVEARTYVNNETGGGNPLSPHEESGSTAQSFPYLWRCPPSRGCSNVLYVERRTCAMPPYVASDADINTDGVQNAMVRFVHCLLDIGDAFLAAGTPSSARSSS